MLKHRDTIERELRSSKEDTLRRKEQARSASISASIRSTYHRFHQQHEDIVMPSLHEFTTLEVVQVLKTLDADGFHCLKQSGELDKLVARGVQLWEAEIRSHFAEKLGYSSWLSISSKILHPVDRVTAYFECNKCHSARAKESTLDTLTFKEACGHVCHGLNAKQRAKAAWKPDMFRADEKVAFH